jgi:two-component sensor histidine kinase
MIQPEYPADENARLSELHSFRILDTPTDPEMDAIVDLLLAVTGKAMGTITFVDADRQWFKSRRNVTAQETSREVAFCAHGILGDDLFVVPDAREDVRFNDNPLVTGDPNIVFYAGMPLKTTSGHNIGMICVQDGRPGSLDPIQEAVVRRLAVNVVNLLELRRERRRNQEIHRELEHRVQNTLQFLSSLLHLHSGTGYCVDQDGAEWIPKFSARLNATSLMLRQFNAYAGNDSMRIGEDVCPIIREMVEEFGIMIPMASWPLIDRDFSISKDRAMVFASLIYELVTTIADQTANAVPEGRLFYIDDVAELAISQTIEKDMYSLLIQDYRFAIIETLSRRLQADGSFSYGENVFTVQYHFPIAS